jgi:hypothetical protein
VTRAYRCATDASRGRSRGGAREPPDAEASLVNTCVSGIDPNTVPGPIAAAFCVCTLNRFEQLYPTYDQFQQATTSGAFTDQLKTAISNACAVQIVGG